MGWFFDCCHACLDSHEMRFFLSLFLFVISLNAVADYQAVKHYRIVFGAYTTPAPITDYNQVCQDFVVWYDQYLTTHTATYIGSTSTDCTFKRSGVTYNDVASISPMKDCSDGLGFRGWDTTPGGSNGNCLGDPPPEPESCEAGCNGACGDVYTLTNISNVPRTACISSCRYVIKQGVTSQGSSGTTTWIEVGDNTGVQCTVSEPPPEAPQPSCPECDCIKSGQSWGYVNGAPVCVKKGTQGSEPVTVNPPDKVTTTTPAPTPENPNPEPVTTTTQQPQVTIGGGSGNSSAGPDDNPDVTTTTTDENGGTVEETQDKESFCQANPTHAICQPKTDCDKNPNAVACLEMGGVPDNESLINIERPIQSITLPNLPQSMGCPAPLSKSIGGQTITISYQPFCDYAEAFRPLVVAGAWLTAAFIIVGFRGGQD